MKGCKDLARRHGMGILYTNRKQVALPQDLLRVCSTEGRKSSVRTLRTALSDCVDLLLIEQPANAASLEAKSLGTKPNPS